jgi:mono/diheme cytochrome c family protein
MPPSSRLSLLLSAATAVSGLSVEGAGGASGVEFFEKRIRPLLVDSCFKCHSESADKVKGGLLLDSRAAALKGGDSGPAIVPGKPDQSRIVEALGWTNPDLQMPPRKQLSPAQIADITAWIAAGAEWPETSSPAGSPRSRETSLQEKGRRHWAFQPVRTEVPPAVSNDRTPVNPIDAFIDSKLKDHGIVASAPSDRRTLIRRVYYDVTGLPPSPEEVEAFVADSTPLAWENLVDQLLASPHYGEKWARHWLDLVRFAETNSYERDGVKPHAWRYRDYVIRALNADKPYDRFIREQLAGDELPDSDDDAVIATGFYRLGIWDDEPADRALATYDQLDDIVATTGQVFLGLTVDCARCHDHKIDPISQRDYYSLVSFFHNVAPYHNGGETDEIPLRSSPDGKALAVTESGTTPPETHVLLRGRPENLGDRVEPAFPLILEPPKAEIIPPASGRSTGRRLALANWIASPENRLTARVIVNRVWQHHFGRGLARTPSDFGLQGLPPTHPELLDWLARDFVDNGWSLKRLHRQILTSSAYRRASTAAEATLKADPSNDLFSRFEMRRLTAEEIRDSAIWVSGPPNPRMFGPGIFVNIPKEVLAGQSIPGNGWGNSPVDEQLRRSIYIHVKRSLLSPVLLGFDLAETDRSVPVRFATTQPTQALGMLNGPFFNEQAERLASRARSEGGSEVAGQVRRVLNLVMSRPPSNSEVTRGVRLIESLESNDGASPRAALTWFCLMALNLNEFLYLD